MAPRALGSSRVFGPVGARVYQPDQIDADLIGIVVRTKTLSGGIFGRANRIDASVMAPSDEGLVDRGVRGLFHGLPVADNIVEIARDLLGKLAITSAIKRDGQVSVRQGSIVDLRHRYSTPGWRRYQFKDQVLVEGALGGLGTAVFLEDRSLLGLVTGTYSDDNRNGFTVVCKANTIAHQLDICGWGNER